MYDREKAAKAQEKYCDKKNLPYFAPSNGRCWSCGRNIYDENGYTVEYAGSDLITGCPYCNHSYCD